MKLFRRLQEGRNPDCEIGKYLTEVVNFSGVPPYAGTIEYTSDQGETISLGILQGYIKNEGEGWKWTVEELERYYENCARLTFPADEAGGDAIELSEHEPSAIARDYIGIYLDSAAALGRRAAQLHLSLAAATGDPALTPELSTERDFDTQFAELRDRASASFDVLKEAMSSLPDDLIELAASVLSRRRRILDRFRITPSREFVSQRTRIHGDFHLGQVLRVKTDFLILDFEGEPARPLAERRSKQSPLKDVAGMLRSFGYAAYAALMNYTSRRPEDLAQLEPWAQLWERSVSAEFLRAYCETAPNAAFLPADRAAFRILLQAYVLDKALYELLYELNHRPSWVRIPLMGILAATS